MPNQFENDYNLLSESIKKKIESLYKSKKKVKVITEITSLSQYIVRKHLKKLKIYNPNRDSIVKKVSKKNPKVSETKYAKIWDYDKNELGPENFTTGSDKKAWWKCNKCKLSWDSAIQSICNPNTDTGCPFCALKRASYFHNLELKFPIQAKQFLIDKNGIHPSKITPGSQKIYWWKCDNNHIFENSPLNMTRTYFKEKQHCDYCPGGNKAWPGESFGDLYPNLVKEIDRNKNKDFDEFSVKPGSQKKINWICKKKHKWKTSIYSRAIEGHGCKRCKMPYSKQEIRIYSELKLLFSDVKIRFTKLKEEIDIFIPSLPLAIEFDGFYWHKNKKNRDVEKTSKLISHNIPVIRIRENLKPINGINIHIKTGVFGNKEFLLILDEIKKFIKNKTVIKKINHRANLESFQNNVLFNKILSDMPAPVYENSLEYVFPAIAKKWDYDKNFPITPDQVSKGTSDIYWFICQKKKHSYDAAVTQVTKNNHKCPYCLSRRIDKSNSLLALYPEIAKFWDYKKNFPLRPEEVAPNYNKHVWWICSKSHPPHEGTCNKKVNSKSGCPYCSGTRAIPELSIKKLHPSFFSKIKRIDRIDKRKTHKDELLHMGEGTHTKVIINCKKCKKEISNEVRGFIAMIKNKSKNTYLCVDCRKN